MMGSMMWSESVKHINSKTNTERETSGKAVSTPPACKYHLGRRDLCVLHPWGHPEVSHLGGQGYHSPRTVYSAGQGCRATAGASAIRPRQPTLLPLLAVKIEEPKTANPKTPCRGDGLRHSPGLRRHITRWLALLKLVMTM